MSQNTFTQKLIKMQENALSFDEIDKSGFYFKNIPLKQQFVLVRDYFNNCFYYENFTNNYNLNPGINNLFIDCRSVFVNGIAFGTGHEARLKKENLIKPNDQLIEGHTIYDLKIKGESIKKVSMIILSDKKYSIEFKNINDQWILPFFTKSNPFILSAIQWTNFYIKIITDKASKVTYSYSASIFPPKFNREIGLYNLEMDKVEYKMGYIKNK